MAATTTLLGLLTPTQGTLSGTWGDSVNYGISDYVDIAIAGTLSFAGDGAITLANTTGSASGNGFNTTTAQYMVIRITGTQSVVKVITGPSYSKMYMVDHAGATSAVTFKAAGQTGVSIAVGEKCFVYYNGTDYVKIAGTVNTGVTSFTAGTTGFTPSTATTGAVTLAGTLNVANGGTGLTSLTANRIPYGAGTSAFGNSAALTFDGTNFATTGRVTALDFVATGSSFYALVSGSTYGSLTATAGTATLNANNGNALIFQVASTETGRFNSAGAFGVGVTPQTGWSGFKAIQLGANTSLWSSTSGGGTSYYSNNLYYNGSNRIYITSGFASEYQQTNTGVHSWFTAPTGTAGNAISLVNTMNLDAVGNLLVGGSAARGTTVGTAHLDLFNGTAPAGTLTNGVSLYSSSGDLKFMNAAGTDFDVGYRNIPQNSQSAAYTLVLADAGKHIFHPSTDANARTFTIPANSSVAYPIGTAITFINMTSQVVTIAITTDTMYLSSAGTTGSRSLAQYGSATAIKMTSTTWLISGSGLT